MIKQFFDDFYNRAELEKIRIYPYKGASKKEDGYMLSLYSLYDSGIMYHRSIYSTEAAALEALKGFSCGTFIEA
jgi:hypothetical protein